jgi:two-component system, chemotaxis family, CheB/CheR fusion protein
MATSQDQAPPPVTQLVAVGASAGGVEALCTLVATLPADFPAPLVVAQHLDPTRPSHLQEILGRQCPLPVRTVVDHEALEPGVVYVVPADRHIALDDHHLSIAQDSAGRPKPSIDRLFRSAAEVFGEGLIAVVLSGLGSDGAAGARRVKEAGGTVVIQNPRTAPYPAMPQALDPTTVDVIADVDAMGPLLHDLLTGAYTPRGPREDRQLRAFLAELRERSGIDFSPYKEPTIQRRLQRRLLATGTQSLEAYRAYLAGHPDEYERLINAFLIKVTEFFRDPALFAHLRTVVLPALVAEGRERGQELRLWSAGSATGEEAYSLALLVAEALGDELDDWTVRIFATDLDGAAVDFARRGVYPASALEAVPPDLLARYFAAEDGGATYTVAKAVRGLLVFGEHDLGQRPPFPRIDLCLCRNVLIYFTPALQRRALELFAFALRDGGYLALGKAETTSPLPEYFAPFEPTLRLYRRRGERLIIPQAAGGGPALAETSARRGRAGGPHATPAVQDLARVRQEARRAPGVQLATEQLLLRLPVGVAVVDRRYDLQRLNGAARQLLGIHEAALGEDLMHQVRGLTPQDQRALRGALDAALSGEARTLEAVPSTAAEPGATRALRLACAPYPAEPEGSAALGLGPAAGAPALGAARVLLVITDVTDVAEARQGAAAAQAEAARLGAVVAELRDTVRALRAANAEMSEANALLRAANEEYVLGNEEVQAAAEEVETLNEEVQASNEELETLNEEQQASNEELEATNAELRARQQETQELAAAVEAQRRRLAAILGSLGEAVLVLDRAGRVAFINARYAELFGAEAAFAAEDAEGRPLPPEATPQERARRGEAFQMTFTRPGGAAGAPRRWYEATGRPVHDADTVAVETGPAGGGEGDSVLVIRDITDRTLRQLQDAFLAVVSHELKPPLTSIGGYLELLARGLAASADADTNATAPATAPAPDPARLAGYARTARAEVRRLQRLVDDLLDASRLEGGTLHLERAPTDLAAVVAQAVETARLLADGRLVRLERPGERAGDAPAPASPLLVDGDAARLEQVALNLLTNAVTHGPGATIAVRLRRVDGMAELEVRDDGPGIDPAAQAGLFTRFYQAGREAASASARQGLGLGLYIAREIVEAHGGHISVASAPGQGAAFTVRLPLLPEGAGGPAPPAGAG